MRAAFFKRNRPKAEFPRSWVVQLGGLEPPTSGSTIRRSNQLSYNCIFGSTGHIGPAQRAVEKTLECAGN